MSAWPTLPPLLLPALPPGIFPSKGDAARGCDRGGVAKSGVTWRIGGDCEGRKERPCNTLLQPLKDRGEDADVASHCACQAVAMSKSRGVMMLPSPVCRLRAVRGCVPHVIIADIVINIYIYAVRPHPGNRTRRRTETQAAGDM